MPTLALEGVDIGNPGIPGDLIIEKDRYGITAGGMDIWGAEDHCFFAYRRHAGDFYYRPRGIWASPTPTRSRESRCANCWKPGAPWRISSSSPTTWAPGTATTAAMNSTCANSVRPPARPVIRQATMGGRAALSGSLSRRMDQVRAQGQSIQSKHQRGRKILEAL